MPIGCKRAHGGADNSHWRLGVSNKAAVETSIGRKDCSQPICAVARDPWPEFVKHGAHPHSAEAFMC